MKRISVFISGEGTNLKNLALKCQDDLRGKAEIGLVFCNKADAKGIEVARRFGLKLFVLPSDFKKLSLNAESIKAYNQICQLQNLRKAESDTSKYTKDIEMLLEKHPNLTYFKEREEYERKIHERLVEEKIDYIFLAGFMVVLSSYFVSKWKGNIFNIHPSLLPSFAGANAVKDAFNYRNKSLKVTGCTAHLVEEGVDSGEIIKQEAVLREKHDTVETLHMKIKKAEAKIYAKVLEEVITSNMIGTNKIVMNFN
jgi:formyltetrahydrofolate-dependent phosphoribosylglycinamide formyltransferase